MARSVRLRALCLGVVLLGSAGGCAATEAGPGNTPSPAPVPGADVVFHGGTVLTMDPSRPRAQALAISGDHIDAVGGDAEVMPLVGTATRLVDLRGATLMPGFVDAHSHYFGAADAADTDIDGISDYLLRNGVTTAAELAVDEGLLAELRRIDEEGDLGVRVSAYLLGNTACGDLLDEWWMEVPATREPGEMLRIGGVKLFSDGGSCNIPAVSFEYLGIGGHGDLYFTAAELVELVRRVESAGHQVAIHALGDRAVETTLDALGGVIGDSRNPYRHRIEHSAVTRPDLRARHGEIGAVTTIFGTYGTCFLTNPSDEFLFRTPPEYLEWEWPWRALLDQNPGAHFGWQGDFPVFGQATPIDALYGFVTRAQVAPDGTVCQPTAEMAAGAITVQEALTLMTAGSAYALFRDDEVGRLAPGMLADVIILSADPTATPGERISGTEVWMTMLGGDVGWCAPGREPFCPGY
jgi:predicted amidohydrolase YtcJ